MLQQQLLLQQVQQQQLMQTVQLDRQMRELARQGPEALKTALRDPQAEVRLVAVLVAGKNGPALTDDLIERLTDDHALVRQAARNGLVGFSTRATTRDGKSIGRPSVDFGPASDANRAAQKAAARKWRTWFDRQQTRVVNLKAPAAPAKAIAPAPVVPAPAAPPPIDAEAEAAQLSKELLDAPAGRREVVLAKLRDSKGVAYTQALAEAIPQLKGVAQSKAREALAERLTRMTAATLGDKLRDDNAEIRRAAALACAMKEMTTHIPDLIAILEDPDPAVPPAARAALKSLTGQDFGSASSRDRAEQTRVIAAWKAWWQKQPGQEGFARK